MERGEYAVLARTQLTEVKVVSGKASIQALKFRLSPTETGVVRSVAWIFLTTFSGWSSDAGSIASVVTLKSSSAQIALDPDKGWTMRIPLIESPTPAYSPRHYWRDDRARCPSEDVAMPTAKAPRLTGLKKLEGKPLELLLRGQDSGDDPMLILRCTSEGFELPDVVNMIASSELYQQGGMVKRITGKSVRTVRRLLKENVPVRLDTPQSIIAYQYAAALELAIEVFGRQAKAESWLEQRATYFYGYVPLDLVGHALGFRMVEEYLNQIKYGVYQ
jgi:uncharacterized protein (DUF2384 family)